MAEHRLEVVALSGLKAELVAYLAQGRSEHFGAVRKDWVQAAEDYFWDEKHQRWRLGLLKRHGVIPGRHRVLDLAAGCGQFVLLALREGFDCDGVEPDAWRLDFVSRKIDLSAYPTVWATRFHQGSAERLPFPDDTFDYITSFQTLEHVSDPANAIAEMVRVTRPGGAIHIMCPDYRSTFEAHYQLPWLPMFPRTLARRYLRLLGRPTKGLDTIKYVTRPRILSWIAKAESRRRFLVLDEDRVMFDNGLRRRRLPRLPGMYWLWRTWSAIRYLGRREFSVSLLIRILEK